MTDEKRARFRERWWHFGRCPRCRARYSNWFVLGVRGAHFVRYCFLCATEAR